MNISEKISNTKCIVRSGEGKMFVSVIVPFADWFKKNYYELNEFYTVN